MRSLTIVGVNRHGTLWCPWMCVMKLRASTVSPLKGGNGACRSVAGRTHIHFMCCIQIRDTCPPPPPPRDRDRRGVWRTLHRALRIRHKRMHWSIDLAVMGAVPWRGQGVTFSCSGELGGPWPRILLWCIEGQLCAGCHIWRLVPGHGVPCPGLGECAIMGRCCAMAQQT